MGRIIKKEINVELDRPLRCGLFNSTLDSVKDNIVVLRDIFSRERIEIDLSIRDELAYTKSNKPIWVNQIGDFAIGNENDLFRSFKFFERITKWNTPDGNYQKGAKPIESEQIDKKKYWHAREGEVHLFNFLRAYHDLDRNSIETDYSKSQKQYNLKKLLMTDSGYEPTIGGCVYIDYETHYEKVIPRYFPGRFTSIFRNLNGNFENYSHVHPSVKEFVNLFNTYPPYGEFVWDRLDIWKPKSKNIINKNDIEI